MDQVMNEKKIMLSPERMGAFIEYVLRPMTEDIRVILEKAKELNLPITEELVKKVGFGLVISHLISEIIRAITYITITYIICQTVLTALY